jgi:hypothetical protein
MANPVPVTNRRHDYNENAAMRTLVKLATKAGDAALSRRMEEAVRRAAAK